MAGMETHPYWLIDNGHGWLVVPVDVVLSSGAEISDYSFVSPDGRKAYLEEDCDAPAFVKAAQIERATAREWLVKRVDQATCRHYPSFRVTDDRRIRQ